MSQQLVLYNSSTLAGAAPLSQQCMNALSMTLECDPALLTYATIQYVGEIDEKVLSQQLCVSSCAASLAEYHTSVSTACSEDPEPWNGVPATFTGDFLWAYQNRTCLKDSESGTFCNSYFNHITIPANYTEVTDFATNDLCSTCFTGLLIQMQASGFSSYDDSTAASWSAIQSHCSISEHYPTAVPTPAASRPTASFGSGAGMSVASISNERTSSCLSGETYIVVADDTCQSIAEEHHVATRALEVLNNVYADCSNLTPGQVLCLPVACTTYLVQPNDTCLSISTAKSVSYTQLYSFNVGINQDCTNLLAGENICISNPAGQYEPTLIADIKLPQTAIFAKTSVLPLGPVAPGTTRNCGRWYQAVSGDTCDMISLHQSIAVPLFRKINPSINADCTNMLAGDFYCVQPTLNWNIVPTTIVAAPTTVPSGTTSTCYAWHTVVSGDNCSALENYYDISLERLTTWNPDLKSDCSNLLTGEAYCVRGQA